MVGPPESQLTLRAQDGVQVQGPWGEPGRCGVPGPAETPLLPARGSQWGAPCPSRRLSTPGRIRVRSDNLGCWNRVWRAPSVA